MNRVILAILIILVILIPVLLYVFRNGNSINNPSTTQNVEGVSTGFIDQKNMRFPNGFSFKTANPGGEGLGKNALYYDYNPKSLSGTEWVSTKKVNSQKEYLEAVRNFNSFYNSQFYVSGWSNEQRVDGHTLQPIAAESQLGQIFGYLKYAGGKVQTVLFYNQKDKTTYPANIQFRVFLSNIYNLEVIR